MPRKTSPEPMRGLWINLWKGGGEIVRRTPGKGMDLSDGW